MCTYFTLHYGNAWSNVPSEKIGMYEKIFCCYKFLQPLVLEIFLWAMEKVCPEVLYEKNWSRASLSTTFFHTRLLEKLFPLPTKIFLTLGCKNYSNKIQWLNKRCRVLLGASVFEHKLGTFFSNLSLNLYAWVKNSVHSTIFWFNKTQPFL